MCLCMFSVVSLYIGLLKHFLHSLSPSFSPSLSLSLSPLCLSPSSQVGPFIELTHVSLKVKQGRERERKGSGKVGEKTLFGITDELE